MTLTNGFSKLSKLEKIDALLKDHMALGGEGLERTKDLIASFWHQDPSAQRTFDEFSENTITNFYAPYGILPGLVVNDKSYCVPMVIEESSVVAAASKAAKFWRTRGGFHCEVKEMTKIGQVHLVFNGPFENFKAFFIRHQQDLLQELAPLMANMEKRGGGLTKLELLDKSEIEPGLYQVFASFDTRDAMGANFINSVLEAIGKFLTMRAMSDEVLTDSERNIEVVMAILSNYTPDCVVRAWVSAPVAELDDNGLGMSAEQFARKFVRAVNIARNDPYRATTHNKGIYNGIDAVVLATGNDFRATAAAGHTYAARDGVYRSLSRAWIDEANTFFFELEVPLAVGSVGGLTALHPMAKFSLDLLGRPGARELMEVIAATGLAQNFAAVRSLVTSGIQKGHMKMHLLNILNHFEATDSEREEATRAFEHEVISFKGVRDFLSGVRGISLS